MKVAVCIQLLVSLYLGYVSCWSYSNELNVCDAFGQKSLTAHQKVLTKDTRGYLAYQWLPRRQPIMVQKRICCPGWGSYVKNYGCWEKLKCQVGLPQKASLECKADRKKQLNAERAFYKYKETKSPNDPNLAPGEFLLPILDQELSTIISKSSLDEVEAHWVNIYFSIFAAHIVDINDEAEIEFPVQLFNQYSQFVDVINFFNDKVKLLNSTQFYWYRNDPTKVLDIFSNGKWMEDKYFAMRRITYYPNNIRKVNMYGTTNNNYFALKAQLNPLYDWDSATRAVTGMSFYMSVYYGLVYVVDHSIMSGIPHMDDISDRDPTDSRILRGPIAPIGIFAVGRDALGKTEFKVVAIQRDRATTSPVLGPNDGNRWMIMKMEFESTEFVIHQVGYHWTEAHLTMERICLSMHRHFATLHPLRQILERHCVGTHGLNSNGKLRIFSEGGIAHRLFGVGNHGSVTVSNRVFKNLKWKDLDFVERMKKSGTLDHKLFPYHPYRDDGALVYGVAKGMANDYTDLYYHTDIDVASDTELQSFANEISLQGINGPDAGKGKFDGFPSAVFTKQCLKQIITQTLWSVIEHNAASFSFADFNIFHPFGPGKVYKDTQQELSPLQSLGDSRLATFQARTAASLALLHYDVLLDYGKYIVDEKGRAVVDRYHTKLMTIIKPIIEKRNVDRLAKEQFSYPYFSPGFMINSISV